MKILSLIFKLFGSKKRPIKNQSYETERIFFSEQCGQPNEIEHILLNTMFCLRYPFKHDEFLD